MIPRSAMLTIRDIPLASIVVTEHQPRYWRQVREYVRLMRAHPDDAPGLLFVKPLGDRYELLDGHHRFCAHIITGRPTARCVVVADAPE